MNQFFTIIITSSFFCISICSAMDLSEEYQKERAEYQAYMNTFQEKILHITSPRSHRFAIEYAEYRIKQFELIQQEYIAKKQSQQKANRPL